MDCIPGTQGLGLLVESVFAQQNQKVSNLVEVELTVQIQAPLTQAI